jgi:hypothetical protein
MPGDAFTNGLRFRESGERHSFANRSQAGSKPALHAHRPPGVVEIFEGVDPVLNQIVPVVALGQGRRGQALRQTGAFLTDA